MRRPTVRLPEGRLAVLLPGLGAVATTMIAGVMLARKKLAQPIGSLTQLGAIPDESGQGKPVQDLLPLATLEQLEFGAWDIFAENAYQSALHAEVLEPRHLEEVRTELERIRPMRAVFFPEHVRRLHGTYLKDGASKAELVEQLRSDIRTFLLRSECARAVAVWCGSTETYSAPSAVHQTVDSFERGLRENDPGITASQIYAWALLQERVPFANGSPNHCVDFPAALALAQELRVPVAGKDFKTGQTLLKTVIAPALRARRLGVRGWYSTNLLGNRDGEVLDDPDAFRSKEISKTGVLENLLSVDDDARLYGTVCHKVRIDYYPPRGDAKEAWDNIDLFGWLGYPMQIKVNFLCRDSILAAPVLLDLALLLDACARADLSGVQEWLGFYFKSPMHADGARPEHDLFRQERALHAAIRRLAGIHAA